LGIKPSGRYTTCWRLRKEERGIRGWKGSWGTGVPEKGKKGGNSWKKGERLGVKVEKEDSNRGFG